MNGFIVHCRRGCPAGNIYKLWLVFIQSFLIVTAIIAPNIGHAVEEDCNDIWADYPAISRLKKLQEQPVTVEVVLPASAPHGPAHTIRGVPPQVKFLTAKGDEIFRYYSKRNVKAVCESQTLVAGNVPYVESGVGRDTFVDLSGVFMTKPEFSAISVGVDSAFQNSFVDFTLPAGTPYLEISKGIWLVPGEPETPNWIKEKYAQWKSNPATNTDSSLLKVFQELDRKGGVHPPLSQKIFIKASSCK